MARYRPNPALKRTTRSAARASQGAPPTPPPTIPAGEQQGAAPVITVDVPSTTTAPPPSSNRSSTTDTSSTTSSSDTTSTSEDESSGTSGDADDSSVRTPAPPSTASPEVTNAQIDNLLRAAERIMPDPRSRSPWRHFDRTPSAPQPSAPTPRFSAPIMTLAWPPSAVLPPRTAEAASPPLLAPTSSSTPSSKPSVPTTPSAPPSNRPPAPPTSSTPRPTVAAKTLSQLRRPSPALFLGSDTESISIGSDNEDGDDTDRTQRPSTTGQDDTNEASDSESEGRAQQSDGGNDSSGSLYTPQQPLTTALGKRRQRDETEAEASALSPPATRRRSPVAGPSTTNQDVRGTLLLRRASRPPADSTTSSIRAENETLNDVSAAVDLTGNEPSNDDEPDAPVQLPRRRKRPKTRIPKKENRFPLMPPGVVRREKKDFPKLDAPLEDGVVLAAESCPRCIKRGIHCTLGTGFHRDDRDCGKGGGRCDYCKIDGSTCTVYKGNQTARKRAYLTIAQCINHLFKLSTKRKYEEDQTLLRQIAASLETSTLNIKGEPFSLDDDDDEESD